MRERGGAAPDGSCLGRTKDEADSEEMEDGRQLRRSLGFLAS